MAMQILTHSVPEAPPVYKKDLISGSDTLIVSFSGYMDIFDRDRPFDFFMMTYALGYNRIMLSDPYRSFYLKGIDARGFDHLVNRLREDIESIKPRRTIFIGASSGAYAALLFAHLLGSVDYIHAFAPMAHFKVIKTVCDGDFIALYHFFSLMVSFGWSLPREHRPYLDLKPLLASRPQTKTKTVLHACAHSRDANRVLYLKHSPQTSVFLYPGKIHNVASILVESGCLRELLLKKNLDQPEEVYRAFYGDFNGIQSANGHVAAS
jgi:hypothetical protein